MNLKWHVSVFWTPNFPSFSKAWWMLWHHVSSTGLDFMTFTATISKQLRRTCTTLYFQPEMNSIYKPDAIVKTNFTKICDNSCAQYSNCKQSDVQYQKITKYISMEILLIKLKSSDIWPTLLLCTWNYWGFGITGELSPYPQEQNSKKTVQTEKHTFLFESISLIQEANNGE